MPIDQLNYVWQELLHGNLSIIYDLAYNSIINNEAIRILNLNPNEMVDYDKAELDLLIKISNIVYNNTESPPPLEDGIYDKLMVRARSISPDNYQIGAPSVTFNNEEFNNKMDSMDNRRNPIIIEPQSVRDGMFYKELSAAPPLDLSRIDIPVDRTKYVKQKKQNIVVPHKYPKLVGTLDKCKFVLNKEAMDLGCFDDPDVTIFERDFLGKHIQLGVINPYDQITLILELKYDGMSVEADVSHKIISARSRGDTNMDLAEDLNGVLKDYEFPYAQAIPDNESFGMKFECIITKDNLWKLGQLKGKTYKNGRNGVVGLMKSLDAYAYRDLITLVPLETSLDIDPVAEIEFMNKYYSNGVYLKYAVVTGDYNSVLYQVYQFVKEAEAIRDFMPFMYDGVVVHYYDNRIRQVLGRKNNVNQYSVAIKFNPMRKEATFTHYSFTVGQNGVITPLIHHTPVEFIGTIHTKSSGHSYQRFRELNLAPGDKIEIEYRNDVMPYVTRRDEEVFRRTPHQEPIRFPTHCPCCGTPLVFLDSGKTAVCNNYNCPERALARITNMMKKLNIKGFAESALAKLNVQSFTDLLSIKNNSKRAIEALGDVMGMKFLAVLEQFLQTRIDDYRVIGALGFTDIAVETWKKILSEVSINDIIYKSNNDLYNILCSLYGIGEVTARTIVNERGYFAKDIDTISKLPNINSSYHRPVQKTIRYTGCRPDEQLTEYLMSLGYDANPNASVTKSTDILIVPEVGHMSSKVKKSGPNTKIIALDEFKRNIDYYLKTYG